MVLCIAVLIAFNSEDVNISDSLMIPKGKKRCQSIRLTGKRTAHPPTNHLTSVLALLIMT
ncbi:MAG: hypothetical protein ACI4GV_04260 [Acutalibacteraceae bacterium]